MKLLPIALLGFTLLFVAGNASAAFTPPTMTAHVTDQAGKLGEGERLALDRKLEDYRLRTSAEIAVFLPTSLEGDSIDDVTFATFRAWHLGAKGKDNGVLLVIAPVERQVRIEVGKGAEGDLPDLKADDVIQRNIKPHLRAGREDWRAAVEDGTDGIMAALGTSGGRPKPAPATGASAALGIILLILVFVVPILLFILVLRALVRAFTSQGPSASRGWASGGTWYNDSSYGGGWGGGGSDYGGGGGGFGGDSGFTGGGGDTGGGGASDSF